MKKIIWMGSSLKDLQDCPEGVKDDVGLLYMKPNKGKCRISPNHLKVCWESLRSRQIFGEIPTEQFIRLNLVKVYMFCMFSRRNLIMENQLQNLICR